MADEKKSVVDTAKDYYQKGKKAVSDYIDSVKSLVPTENDVKGIGEVQKNVDDYKKANPDAGKPKDDKPIASYKKGTDHVPATGMYRLHEGESVNTKEETEKHQFHRSMSHLKKGALHRHFNIPEDQPIPIEKKMEAANSDDPHVSKMGHLAVAMAHWHHKHGKK